MKQGRNGNVGEFQAHDYFIFFNLPSHDQFRLCARSFWSNHKDVSNNITYEHLRQLLLNNETKQLDPSLQAGFFTTWKNEVVMCLEFTDITIPTLFHCFLQHPFLH